MLKMASNPEFWKSLREGNARQRDELARQQYQDIKDRTPGMWDDVRRTVGNVVGTGGTGGGLGRSIGELTDRWADNKRKEAARERGDYYVSESPYGGLSSSQVDAWAARKQAYGTFDMSTKSSDPSARRSADVWRDMASLDRGKYGDMGWREKALRVVSPLANIPIAFASGGASIALGLAGADIDYGTAEKGLGWLAKQNLSPTEARNLQRTAAAKNRQELTVYDDAKKYNALATDKASMDANDELSKRLGFDSTSFILSLGHDVGRYAESKFTRIGENGRVNTTAVRDLTIKRLISTKPEFAAMAKTDPNGAWNAASKFFESLPSEAKARMTGGAMRIAKEVTGEKGANVLGTGEAEMRTGSGMANLEDVQEKIRQTKKTIDSSFSSWMGGGVIGQDSQALQESLLGATPEQQTAMSMIYGGGDTEKTRALLKSQLQLANPKATAREIEALANQTVADVMAGVDSKGKTILSPEAKEQLKKMGSVGRARGEGATQLEAKLRNVSKLTGGMIEAMGEAGTADFMGTSWGRDKLRGITAADIKALETSSPEQARAAKRYKAAMEAGSDTEMEKAKAAFEKAGVAKMSGLAGKDVSMLEATGPEADQLAGSMAAIDAVASSMEKAFANFTPNATKNFADGAKALAAFARQQAEKNAQANPQTQGNTTDG
jgi:hypothetical protein